jgi:hypothetical protein
MAGLDVVVDTSTVETSYILTPRAKPSTLQADLSALAVTPSPAKKLRGIKVTAEVESIVVSEPFKSPNLYVDYFWPRRKFGLRWAQLSSRDIRNVEGKKLCKFSRITAILV